MMDFGTITYTITYKGIDNTITLTDAWEMLDDELNYTSYINIDTGDVIIREDSYVEIPWEL